MTDTTNTEVVLNRTRHVTAVVKEEFSYRVSKDAWEKAMEDADGDADEAFEAMRSDRDAAMVRENYDAEVQNVMSEHDNDIEVEEIV